MRLSGDDLLRVSRLATTSRSARDPPRRSGLWEAWRMRRPPASPPWFSLTRRLVEFFSRGIDCPRRPRECDCLPVLQEVFRVRRGGVPLARHAALPCDPCRGFRERRLYRGPARASPCVVGRLPDRCVRPATGYVCTATDSVWPGVWPNDDESRRPAQMKGSRASAVRLTVARSRGLGLRSRDAAADSELEERNRQPWLRGWIVGMKATSNAS